MSKQYVANVLKKLRTQSGMTADDVGQLVGKSGKTVNGWENARSQPDAEMLLKLCDIYNVKDILAEFQELKLHIVESDNKQKLVELYEGLNNIGKRKAIDYMNDLAQIAKYKKSESIKSIVAARSENNDQGITTEYVQDLSKLPQDDTDL